MLNVLGLHHMLECARQKETKRVHAKYMVHRTVEQDYFTEQSFGHIDYNTLRVWLSRK